MGMNNSQLNCKFGKATGNILTRIQILYPIILQHLFSLHSKIIYFVCFFKLKFGSKVISADFLRRLTFVIIF